MSNKRTGGCACGRIRFEAELDGDDAYLCHCRMCQRSSGNVSLALTGVAQNKVSWNRDPDWYESSEIARRPFCSSCGTSLGFAYRDSKDMDLTVASFDDASAFRPTSHFGVESMHRQWVDTSALPEKRTDELHSVVDRWVKATGSFKG